MKKAIVLILSGMLLLGAAMLAEAESFSYDDLYDLDFCFSSGAGAWSTYLHIEPDGSFTAKYYDADIGDIGEDHPDGTVYLSAATGQLGEPVQVNEYTWNCPILSIVKSDAGESIENGILFIAVPEIYGLENTDHLLLYPQGAPVAHLPEGFLSWAQDAQAPDLSGKLLYYGIYNEEADCGFISEDRYADVKELPVQLDLNALDKSGELTACLSADSFLGDSLQITVGEPYWYNTDSLRALQPGDIIHTPSMYQTVESVVEKDGRILVNGGSEDGSGSTFVLNESRPDFAYAYNGIDGPDDFPIRRIGTAAIALADTVTYSDPDDDNGCEEDDSEKPLEPKYHSIPGNEFCKWLQNRWGEDSKYYDYFNAKITLENGKICKIEMKILPEMDD